LGLAAVGGVGGTILMAVGLTYGMHQRCCNSLLFETAADRVSNPRPSTSVGFSEINDRPKFAALHAILNP